MDHIKKKLINDFIDEVTTQGFECIPIFTMDEEERFISLKVSDESEVPIFEIYFSSGNYVSFYKSLKQSEGNPMIEINFALYNYLHIMPTMDPKVREADWLFNRVVLLIQDLKEASNEN